MSEHHTDPSQRPDPHGDESAQPTAELPRADQGQPPAIPAERTSTDVGSPQTPTGTIGPDASRTAAPETPVSPGSAAPPSSYAYQPGWAAPGHAAPGQAVPGQAVPGQAGPAEGHGQLGQGQFGYGQEPYQPHPQPHTAPMPAWGYGPPTPPRRSRRAGKVVAGTALALVLMAGSGLAGSLVTLAATDEPAPTRTFAAAPIINSADLPAIAASVENSVVSISTGSGEGSGVVLSADGYLLTNNHVVASAQGGTVNVLFADGESAKGRVVGTDPKTDLAVVKADKSGLTPAKLGDSDAMRVGDTVLALGSPLGLQGSVTAGIISARDRTIRAGEGTPQAAGGTSISGLLQTDAPINPGNSGGALVNTKGEVIGINTAIATAGQGSGNIGVGFAIPSNKAKQVADALQKGQKVSHPYLGVSVTRSDDGGAVVGSVTPGSPADKAGLQEGDVITKFRGEPIVDSDALVGAVQSGKVGDRVEVTYLRNGTENTATVTLAEAS